MVMGKNIPLYHNFPLFFEGISPHELHSTERERGKTLLQVENFKNFRPASWVLIAFKIHVPSLFMARDNELNKLNELDTRSARHLF